MLVDFHLHTDFSDGTFAPLALLDELKKLNLDYFSITDHDSMGAYRELLYPPSPQPSPLVDSASLTTTLSIVERVEGEGRVRGSSLESRIKLITGVEINTNDESETLHILGYGHSLLADAGFQETLKDFREARKKRARAIVMKLNGLGIAVTFAEVEARARESLGRPHIADVLAGKGIATTRKEAFRRFLLRGRSAYVAPLGPDPGEAIRAIRLAGGLAVLAHPGIARIDERRLNDFVAQGLDGIEVYYPDHTQAQVQDDLCAARKYGVL
ncbi:MAG: PHP domain-containing protein, partial [Elusimicrobia bacterium]|nr:PHP domain-containing protein [Elusimicrobiota bacterium]